MYSPQVGWQAQNLSNKQAQVSLSHLIACNMKKIENMEEASISSDQHNH